MRAGGRAGGSWRCVLWCGVAWHGMTSGCGVGWGLGVGFIGCVCGLRGDAGAGMRGGVGWGGAGYDAGEMELHCVAWLMDQEYFHMRRVRRTLSCLRYRRVVL